MLAEVPPAVQMQLQLMIKGADRGVLDCSSGQHASFDSSQPRSGLILSHEPMMIDSE